MPEPKTTCSGGAAIDHDETGICNHVPPAPADVTVQEWHPVGDQSGPTPTCGRPTATGEPCPGHQPDGDGLPQQLRYLFGSEVHIPWADLDPEVRRYWEHQAIAVRAAVQSAPLLSAAERTFLSWALDEAADIMAERDGFTDADEAALASLRTLAGPDDAATADVFTEDELHEMDRDAEYAHDAAEDAARP
ncbi:hypothetical protein [Actinacidiphila sp. bgisy145]|uniref:hypothetical protein n=1 Tax=Actinacidiphila sp. bgisy145 TaxID=3413792 RepID=UPI003EC0B361